MVQKKFTLNENELKYMIKKMLKESIAAMSGNMFEKKEDDGEDGRLSDMNTENDNDAEVRDSIENFFKQPGVNNAPYAYSLYGVEAEEGKDTNDMKNARKKFADCVNHEKNEQGYPYSFSSAQLNKLKGMISGNQLSEAVNNAMKKVLNERNTVSENTDNDVAWQEYLNEQKSVLEQLIEIFQKNGIESAQLTTYRSGLPVIAMNTDEYYHSKASEIASKFAEQRRMYVTENDYPATTYIYLNKLYF